jgi:hypothetical protein
MTIKGLLETGLYDENEQVAILYGDVNTPHRPYTGRLVNIPAELQNKEITQISAMGESRRGKYNLNKYGWTEIWVDED